MNTTRHARSQALPPPAPASWSSGREGTLLGALVLFFDEPVQSILSFFCGVLRFGTGLRLQGAFFLKFSVMLPELGCAA